MLKQILRISLAFIVAIPAPAFAADVPTAADWWREVKNLRNVECERHLSALTQGRLVHREEGETFELDAQTIKDLDIAKLLFPLYTGTDDVLIGRSRLATMLTETAVDAEEIRLRREAVRELEDNEKLLFDLRAQLKLIEKWANADSETIGFVSGRPITDFSWKLEAIGAGIVVVGGGLFLNSSYAHPENIKELIYWSFLPAVVVMFVLPRLARAPTWFRARHVEIKTTLDRAEQIAALLANVKSVRLREVAATLKELNRKDLDAPANPLVRAYVNLRDGKIPAFLLNYSFISAITMRRLNEKLRVRRQPVLRLFSALSELAALSSVATYGRSHPALVEPELIDGDGTVHVEIDHGHHPHVIRDPKQHSVANSLTLSAESDQHRAMILTGINGGGKSTVMRMFASLTLMAQIGSRVPAAKMRWTPTAVATNMAVTDSVTNRESFFQAQSARVGEMLEQISDQPRALLIMDEIFTGTSPEERAAGERAILRYLASNPGIIAILSTHDRNLGALADDEPQLINMHVGDGDEPPFTLQPGVSRTRNALRVMRQAGLPNELLELVAEEMAKVPAEWATAETAKAVR